MGPEDFDGLFAEVLVAVERQAPLVHHTREAMAYLGSLDALGSPEVLERYEALFGRLHEYASMI
jgi:hypothetical protein